MARDYLTDRTGGVALVVGYSLLFGVLVVSASDPVETATEGVQEAVFFILLPLLGIASGVYLLLERPLRTTPAFITASYLSMTGIGITLLESTNPVVTTGIGLILLALGVLTIVAILRSVIARSLPGQPFS